MWHSDLVPGSCVVEWQELEGIYVEACKCSAATWRPACEFSLFTIALVISRQPFNGGWLCIGCVCVFMFISCKPDISTTNLLIFAKFVADTRYRMYCPGNDHRVHTVLEKSLKVLEFCSWISRSLKVLEKSSSFWAAVLEK